MMEQFMPHIHCVCSVDCSSLAWMNFMSVNRLSQPRFKASLVILVVFMLLVNVMECNTSTTTSPLPTGTVTASPIPSVTLNATTTPEPTLVPTATVPPILCGGPPTMTILLIGSDARANNYRAGLADSIRVVRVDFTGPRLQIISFPRDLYVEIPGIADHHDITHGKLNQAYLYGNPGYGYFDGFGQGSGLLALTLEQDFGVHIDHFIAVNLQAFSKIVDALGGIDITLPEAIDGRVKRSKDPNHYFKAGDLHLNGYRTMLLARVRPQGDFQRAQIQNLILQALARKILTPTVLTKAPKLVETFATSTQTDLGSVEASQLVCLAASLDPDQIVFREFPETLFTSERIHDPVLGNTSVLNADAQVIKLYVQLFNAGLWPAPNDDPYDSNHRR
jgi:LCP family protein required for cell wall assembly